MEKGGKEMKKNWIKYAVALFSVLFLLAACGGGNEKTSDVSSDDNASKADDETKKYKVGVTQIVEHPSLNAAYDGFQQALEDAGLEVEYDHKLRKGIKVTIRLLRTTLPVQM